MPKFDAPLYSFNRGEVSKIALARIDIEKMRLSAETQVNWMPWVIGPMMLRPGLQYVGEVLEDQPCRAIPFVFSKLDTALLELTSNVMRVWVDEELVTRPAVTTTIGDPTLTGAGGYWLTANTTSGATVTFGAISGAGAILGTVPVGGLAQIEQTLTILPDSVNVEHGLRIAIANGPVTLRVGSAVGGSDLVSQTVIDTGMHCLAFTPVTTTAVIQIESADAWNKIISSVTIDAAGPLEVPTPWDEAALPDLRWDQSGDVVFVAAYGMQQYKIERRSVHGWSTALYRSSDGPFQSVPGIVANLTPSAMYGNGTLSSDRPWFQEGHVGALFRLFSNGQTNQAVLGAENAYTDPVRVSGVGQSRDYQWTITGTWTGTLSFQRSFTDYDAGFITTPPTDGQSATTTANGVFASSTGMIAGTPAEPDLDNIVCWERIGLAGGGSIVAAGPISTSSATITMPNVSAYPWVTPGMSVYDQTANVPIGTVSSYSGTTLTLTAVASNNGSGSSDTLVFSSYGSGTALVVSGYSGDGGFGICRVTGYISPTEVEIEILQPFSSLQATTNWLESQWSSATSGVGFPTSVCFHEGRLGWFGQDYMWLSASDDFTSFALIDSQGNDVGDAGPIIYEMGSGPVDSISWGLSLLRLLLGREQSIGSARSSSFDEPLTASNISIKDCATQGAERLPAVKVDKRGIYVQQSGVRVFELAYNAMEMDYSAHDLTRLNLDIGQPGFVDIGVQRQPDTFIHLPRADGEVAVLLYDPEDEVECWWRIQTQGVVENVAVLPGSASDDLVYYVVRRNIGGVTKRFIERFAPRTNCAGGLVNQQADCFVSYSGAPVTSVVLSQLPDTQVVVWADGASLGTTTTDAAGNCAMPDGKAHANIVAGLGGQIFVGTMAAAINRGLPEPTQTFTGPSNTLTLSPYYADCPAEVFADVGGLGKLVRIGTVTVSVGGVITLPNNQVATTIVASIGYIGLFQSARLAYASQSGTALTKKKRVSDVGIVGFDMAQGALSFGPDFAHLDPMPMAERGETLPAGTLWSEYDEPMISFPGSWDTDARLCLQAAAPNPVKVGAVVIALEEVDG